MTLNLAADPSEWVPAARLYLLLIANSELSAGRRGGVAPSDLVQETLLRAHRRADEFRGATEAEYRGWLRRILLNLLTDHARRPVPADLPAGLPDPSADPAEVVRRREEFAALDAALGRLPARYRLVLELRQRERLPWSGVGERLGVSADAARMIWNRAIHALRDVLGGAE